MIPKAHPVNPDERNAWRESEAKIALNTLASRPPNLRFPTWQAFDFDPNMSFRGPKELLAEWDAGETAR